MTMSIALIIFSDRISRLALYLCCGDRRQGHTAHTTSSSLRSPKSESSLKRRVLHVSQNPECKEQFGSTVWWATSMSKTFESVHSGRHCTHSQHLQLQWHRSSIHPTPNPCLRRTFRLVSERQQPHHSLSRQVRLFKSTFSKPFASSSSSRPLAQAVAPAQEYSHAPSSPSSTAFDGLCQMWVPLACALRLSVYSQEQCLLADK